MISPRSSRKNACCPAIFKSPLAQRGTLRFKKNGGLLADNPYWNSSADDDLGAPKKDIQCNDRLVTWTDLSALNTMSRVNLKASANVITDHGQNSATITLQSHQPDSFLCSPRNPQRKRRRDTTDHLYQQPHNVIAARIEDDYGRVPAAVKLARGS